MAFSVMRGIPIYNLQFRHLADTLNPERLTVCVSTGKYNIEHFYTYHLVDLTIDYTVYNLLGQVIHHHIYS